MVRVGVRSLRVEACAIAFKRVLATRVVWALILACLLLLCVRRCCAERSTRLKSYRQVWLRWQRRVLRVCVQWLRVRSRAGVSNGASLQRDVRQF